MIMFEEDFINYIEIFDTTEPIILEESFQKIVTERKIEFAGDSELSLVLVETLGLTYNKKFNMTSFVTEDVMLFAEDKNGNREEIEVLNSLSE